jgi:putative DNA primase/helicase
VNDDAYLKDATGGRRFWPVRCGSLIDYEGLERDRDALWAEALELYRANQTWWPQEQTFLVDASEEQADRFDTDPWHPLIENFVASRTDVTIEAVLQVCIDKPKHSWQQPDKNRIARCLKAMGWNRKQRRDAAGKRYWVYEKVTSD